MAPTQAHIAKLLREDDRIEKVSKIEFRVTHLHDEYSSDQVTPATLLLSDEGIHIGGNRVIPYELSIEYLTFLIEDKPPGPTWTKKKHKQHLQILALLYGNRTLDIGKKSFTIDNPDKPSTIHLSRGQSVKIDWDDGKSNIYDYQECVHHFSQYGQTPVPNIEMTGFATMEEIERNPHLLCRLLGPGHPSPATFSLDALRAAQAAIISTEKQRWHHPETNVVFVTEPGDNVKDAVEHCTEIDKPRMKELRKRQGAKKVDEWSPPSTAAPKKRKRKSKPADPDAPKTPRAPRGKGLGVGGKPLDAKQLKAAQKEIAGVTAQGKRIRLLITKYDADNETICDIVECEDVAVQRTRRAILREAKS